MSYTRRKAVEGFAPLRTRVTWHGVRFLSALGMSLAVVLLELASSSCAVSLTCCARSQYTACVVASHSPRQNCHALLLSLQGHMVPMDQPAAAQDMINRFMYNKDLADEDDVVTAAAAAAAQAPTDASTRRSVQLPAAESRGAAVAVQAVM